MKKAHQIQESGEFQEFNDDVDYILDALQDNNPIGTRCLSAITLATKCTEPAFRMHVRAHGTVTKFFKALHDATKDQVSCLGNYLKKRHFFIFRRVQCPMICVRRFVYFRGLRRKSFYLPNVFYIFRDLNLQRIVCNS